MTALALATLPLLHTRWEPLRPHATQRAFYLSQHRFNVVPAGRRSGKTEIAKRRLVKRAVRGSHFDRPRYFYAAPTYGQVKRIAWADLKRLVPPAAMRGRPSESELVIPLWHGGEIFLVGMDKPERIEGAPVDGGVLDEYGNMKEQAWGENVRPTLSDRLGFCDLIGVPEGRNHYYDTDLRAQAEMAEFGAASEWAHFHWVSADILPAAEIEAAKRDLDPLTYAQEYEGSFVNFEGRAYYAFTDANKARLRSLYDPKQPLKVCLDFNVAPGVAAIVQEIPLVVTGAPRGGVVSTCVIGEVWIDNNSNTPAVCRKVLTDWAGHQGLVEVYGDATGGARGTAQVSGSDWDLARKVLREGEPSQQIKGFGGRVSFYVKTANPAERARVNAVNSRTRSMSDAVRLYVDPAAAPHVVRDLEGVRTLKGGSGEIDKKVDPKLTHISDAIGYYIDYRFPIGAVPQVSVSTFEQ
ncbi:MAG: hypothetical protein H0X39_13020 [Actinobacteria bacterium]|nr:hypothetical protein [Actinomycetota bacterium]